MSEENTNNQETQAPLTLEDKYGSLDVKSLISKAKELINDEVILQVKADMDYIRMRVLNELDSELTEKKEAFVADGGDEIDFEWHQPLREEIRDVYKAYRSKKKNKQDEIRKTQEANLQRKMDIIEEIKELAKKEEGINETFPAFRALQEAWRNTGPVPKAEANELYRNYNYYVEAFYDIVQIDRELRDLDFKKNAEAKEKIIAKAQELAESENIIEALRGLQRLHKEWKETGPVSREDREPMWERFSEITKQIHDKREAYEAQRLEEDKQRIAQKANICEQLESLELQKIKSHNQWQKTLDALEKATAAYKAVGYAKLPENEELWERFRAVNRKIHQAKNEFYKKIKQEYQDNLKSKRDLIEKAEALKESTDWKNTSNELKKLQRLWKETGVVSKKDSQKVWEEFRSACDHFFNRMKEHFDAKDKDLEKNFEAKTALLEELSKMEKPEKDQLLQLLHRWKEIGAVPRDKKEVEFSWNTKIDEAFASIDMDKLESALLRYRAKIESALSGENTDVFFKKESSFLQKKMDEAKKELAQLNENIMRITGDLSNPFFKEVRKNQRYREEQIELLKKKIKLLRGIQAEAK
jgi:hypothetical protein